MNRVMAREWTHELCRRYLPDEPDAYQYFIHLADISCPDGGRAVDLGCGEEGYLAFLMGKAREVIGVDERELAGPYHRYLRSDLDSEIPLEDESIDLIASKFLLEHLREPAGLMKEARRVLRPGGSLLLMTPNILYYPYAVNFVLSRVLSQKHRMRLVELVTGRPMEEVYPVHYRCNTPPRMRATIERAGLEAADVDTFSDCYVSAVTRPLGAVAVAYELVLNRLGIRGLKGFIVARARRA